MHFYEVLGSTTCLFNVRLSIAQDYCLVNDTSINPHLMIGSTTDGADRRNFLIYPEPEKDNQFRIQLKSYLPGKYVESSGNEGPFKAWYDKNDTDSQRFRFLKTSPPATVPAGTPPGVDWYLIQRVSDGLVLTWGGVVGKYAHAMATAAQAQDSSKVWFEPVDQIVPAVAAEQKNVEPKFPDETPLFVARDAIPAALVNLENLYSTKWDQIKVSPYFYLELEKFWQKTGAPVQLERGGSEERIVKYYETYSETDYTAIQQTIGHTFKSEIEVGYKSGNETGGPYGSLKLSYEYTNQKRTDASETITTTRGEERSEKKTFTFKSEPGEKENHQAFQLVRRYTLKNTAGSGVKKWEYAEPGRIEWQRTVQPVS